MIGVSRRKCRDNHARDPRLRRRVNRVQTVVRNYKMHAVSPLGGKVAGQYTGSRITAEPVVQRMDMPELLTGNG